MCFVLAHQILGQGPALCRSPADGASALGAVFRFGPNLWINGRLPDFYPQVFRRTTVGASCSAKLFASLRAPSWRAAQDKLLFQTAPKNSHRIARGRKRARIVCSSTSLYSNSSSSRQRPNLWTRPLGCFRSTTYRHHSPVRGALLRCPRKLNNFSEPPPSVDNCQDMRLCHTGLSTDWRDGSVKNAGCSAVERSSRRGWAS